MGTSQGFDTGPDGNIITRPLIGYRAVPVADTAILARLEYVENEEQLRTGVGQAVQLILTPQQALEVAGVLTKHARYILGQSVPEDKN
jgi:hypothetical protein